MEKGCSSGRAPRARHWHSPCDRNRSKTDANRICLVSVLSMSSEWWRCVSGVMGTGSSRSPRRSGIRHAVKSPPECHRVRASRLRSGGRCRCLLGTIDCARVVPASIAHKVITFRCSTTTPDIELLELLRARPDAQCVHLHLDRVELGLLLHVLFTTVFRRHRGSDCTRHGAQTSDRATCSDRPRALTPRGALPTLRFLSPFFSRGDIDRRAFQRAPPPSATGVREAPPKVSK